MKYDNWTLLPQKIDPALRGSGFTKFGLFSAIIVGDDICDSTTAGTGAVPSTGTGVDTGVGTGPDIDPACVDQAEDFGLSPSFCSDTFALMPPEVFLEGVSQVCENEGFWGTDEVNWGKMGDMVCKESCNRVLGGGYCTGAVPGTGTGADTGVGTGTDINTACVDQPEDYGLPPTYCSDTSANTNLGDYAGVTKIMQFCDTEGLWGIDDPISGKLGDVVCKETCNRILGGDYCTGAVPGTGTGTGADTGAGPGPDIDPTCVDEAEDLLGGPNYCSDTFANTNLEEVSQLCESKSFGYKIGDELCKETCNRILGGGYCK